MNVQLRHIPRDKVQELKAPRTWFAAVPDLGIPELREAHEAFYGAVFQRLPWAPAPQVAPRGSLAPSDWNRVVLGQISGQAFVKELAGRVRIIASPTYQAWGCDGAFVRSAVLVRAGDRASSLPDLVDRSCVVDVGDQDSRNLLRAEIAAITPKSVFFHRLSLATTPVVAAKAVANGEEDALLVDAVSLAHLQRWRPDLAGGLRLIHWTARSPGAPLVGSRLLSAEQVHDLQNALADALRDPTLADVRRDLLIQDAAPLPPAHYRSLLHFEQIASSQGYSELR